MGGSRHKTKRKRRSRSPSRIACINLPHVAVALEERDNRALIGRPLAIETPQPGPRAVYDLSYTAHRAGITRGMTLAQARKVCPEITVLPARIDAYRDTFQLMLEVLATFTPNVEPADFEHSWLAAGGLSPKTGIERSLAEELVRGVRREVGLFARVGMAHGKQTSKIVTRYLEQRDIMVLPQGKEVAFLGGLATRYLPLSMDNHRRLATLGLTKIHQYAALPGRGILPRFGYDGLRAYELSHGRDDAQVRPWQEEAPLEAEHVFLEPIANLRSVRHHLKDLTHQIAKPLASRFQMAGALTHSVVFEDDRTSTHHRTLVEPIMTASSLLVHVDAVIEQVEWNAPVERLTLSAHGLCPTVGHQLELFRSEHEARAGVERTLRRIQTKYGSEVVQQGRVLEPESPLPERRAYLAQW